VFLSGTVLYTKHEGLRGITGLAEIILYCASHSFGTLVRNEFRLPVDDIGEELKHVDNGHVATDI
jgi:hypothetical protein